MIKDRLKRLVSLTAAAAIAISATATSASAEVTNHDEFRFYELVSGINIIIDNGALGKISANGLNNENYVWCWSGSNSTDGFTLGSSIEALCEKLENDNVAVTYDFINLYGVYVFDDGYEPKLDESSGEMQIESTQKTQIAGFPITVTDYLECEWYETVTWKAWGGSFSGSIYTNNGTFYYSQNASPIATSDNGKNQITAQDIVTAGENASTEIGIECNKEAKTFTVPVENLDGTKIEDITVKWDYDDNQFKSSMAWEEGINYGVFYDGNPWTTGSFDVANDDSLSLTLLQSANGKDGFDMSKVSIRPLVYDTMEFTLTPLKSGTKVSDINATLSYAPTEVKVASSDYDDQVDLTLEISEISIIDTENETSAVDELGECGSSYNAAIVVAPVNENSQLPNRMNFGENSTVYVNGESIPTASVNMEDPGSGSFTVWYNFTIDHDFGDEDGTNAKYKDLGESGHIRLCLVCGEQEDNGTAVSEHTYDNDGKCVCGHTKPAESTTATSTPEATPDSTTTTTTAADGTTTTTTTPAGTTPRYTGTRPNVVTTTKATTTATSGTTTTAGTTATTTTVTSDDSTLTPPENDNDDNAPFTNGGNNGWDEIKNEIKNADDGDKIYIDMNGTTNLPKDILEEIKGKDVTIELDIGDGFTWEINGKDVTSPRDLDLAVSRNSGIPVRIVNALTGEMTYVTLSLEYEGEFGCKAVLKVDMGGENSGYWANLYWYIPEDEVFEFTTSGFIDENGMVRLEFEHASEYIIIIDEHDHGKNADEEIVTTEGDNNPHTGVVLSFSAVTLAAAVVLATKKKNK